MEFENAIKLLKKGERIKRSHWRSAYLEIIQNRVKMRMGYRKPWGYIFKDNDIFATDWVISTKFDYEDDQPSTYLEALNFN